MFAFFSCCREVESGADGTHVPRAPDRGCQEGPRFSNQLIKCNPLGSTQPFTGPGRFPGSINFENWRKEEEGGDEAPRDPMVGNLVSYRKEEKEIKK